MSMQVNVDPLQTKEAHYAKSIEILMVGATDGFDMEVDKSEHIPAVDAELQLVYPQAEEGLVDFLERWKLSESQTMLCPRSSIVFDKEATKKLEDTKMHDSRKRKGGNLTSRLTFDK